MLYLVTTMGTVNIFATSTGTPTSFMLRSGSGDITVLEEKFTLLPLRLPLSLPSLPFSLWASVLRVFLPLCESWNMLGNSLSI